jgi:hypothetical protein
MTFRLTRADDGPGRSAGRRRAGAAGRLAIIAAMAAALGATPPAAADADTLTAALMAARAASCPPLKRDPIVERAAFEVNDSTNKWIDHSTRAAPVSESLPLLRDLGYHGSKSTIVVGAGRTAAIAIKALIVQGYAKIPDCSYVDYGASSIHNESKDMILTTVVLAA